MKGFQKCRQLDKHNKIENWPHKDFDKFSLIYLVQSILKMEYTEYNYTFGTGKEKHSTDKSLKIIIIICRSEKLI